MMAGVNDESEQPGSHWSVTDMVGEHWFKMLMVDEGSCQASCQGFTMFGHGNSRYVTDISGW